MHLPKNILLIAFYFPPYSHPGIQRPLKFAKYLPFHGYHPIVFTCGNMEWKSFDFDLYKHEVKDKIEVYKANAPRFSSIGQPLFSSYFMDKWILKMETIFFEDRFDWALGVRQEAMELVRRRNIDLIYTTGPPHSVHFLGYYVKKNTGIPWVMDFRDPMTKHAPTAGLGRLKTFCEELKKKTLLFLYESMFIRKADRVITATEPITQDLKALHPQNSPKITTITNGFDEQDFIGVTPRNGERRRLTIVYTGRFWAHQSPFDFLEGAKLALKRNPKLKDEMRVFFIGDINPQHTKLLTSPELFGTVQILGAMPHRDAISYQLGGDVNLLIVTPSEEKGGSRIFTGKIFEYLRAGRPILAIVPKGITWELIELQNLGYTVHPTDHSGIAQAIIAIYEKWRNSDLESFQLSPKLLREYDRRNLTEKLVKIFHGCFS